MSNWWAKEDTTAVEDENTAKRGQGQQSTQKTKASILVGRRSRRRTAEYFTAILVHVKPRAFFTPLRARIQGC